METKTRVNNMITCCDGHLGTKAWSTGRSAAPLSGGGRAWARKLWSLGSGHRPSYAPISQRHRADNNTTASMLVKTQKRTFACTARPSLHAGLLPMLAAIHFPRLLCASCPPPRPVLFVVSPFSDKLAVVGCTRTWYVNVAAVVLAVCENAQYKCNGNLCTRARNQSKLPWYDLH